MNTQEILSLLTLLATIIIGIVGFAFTIYQIKKSNKVKQAEFVNKLLENIRLNEKVLNAIYIIDYNEQWYTSNFHQSGDLEKSIDALFTQIDYVCYLYNEKLLSDKDFAIFKYEVLRIYNNHQCLSYLWNLYHWTKINSKSNNSQCSFNNLINFIKTQFNKNELMRFESTSEIFSGYKKRLNF